jgi:hypothetical protein
VGDVVERPFLGMQLVLDGRVLGRQAERVPAEGVQDVEALHALQTRHHVADHVVPDVANVGVPRGVREHLEAVELRTRTVLVNFEGAGLGPALLPLGLDCLGCVVRHGIEIIA